jgi:hypothetical protein
MVPLFLNYQRACFQIHADALPTNVQSFADENSKSYCAALVSLGLAC